jgi:hypothetical protein
MLGGLSVDPLTTYPGQLDYTGLFLGTLRLSWDLCGSYQIDLRSPRRKP